MNSSVDETGVVPGPLELDMRLSESRQTEYREQVSWRHILSGWCVVAVCVACLLLVQLYLHF